MIDWSSLLFERNEEERKRLEAKRKLQETCKHESGTYTECTDFHRRDFGTFCKDCHIELSNNG